MFTGLIQEIGKVFVLKRKPSFTIIGVSLPGISTQVKAGDSVSVNGACLTVTRKEKDTLFFDAVEPTLAVSNLKRLKIGDYVNIEPALTAGDKIGGHFVLGHVDTEVKVKRVVPKGGYRQFEVMCPSVHKRFLLKNCSLALEGVSLTVKEVLPRSFRLDIIPFTYQHTTLQYKRAGDWLNVEFDYLLKKREAL